MLPQKSNVVYLEEVGSTQDVIKEQFENGTFVEGNVVWTKNQTAGRGRNGKTWEANKGKALSMSVGVTLEDNVYNRENMQALSVIAGKVVYDLMLDFDEIIIPEFMWPNDILIDCKKIAGVLLEFIDAKDGLLYYAAGFGLNTEQDDEEFGTASKAYSEFRLPPTSLRLEGVDVDDTLYEDLVKVISTDFCNRVRQFDETRGVIEI